MANNLKAENLTISVPDSGCNKHCPYCVAEMTGDMQTNFELMQRNLQKVVLTAQIAEVTSVLFTGKGEPLLEENKEYLVKLAYHFKNWPLEIQTNGISLLKDKSWVDFLFNLDFNVIAISVDSASEMNAMADVFRHISNAGLVTRMTLNVTRLLQVDNFEFIHEYCRQNNVNQLTLRKIVAPHNPKNLKVAEWIQQNADPSLYERLANAAKNYVYNKGYLIRTTKDGLSIWDCDGIAYAQSEYCIQESNKTNDVRSLIFAEDGHLYTSWSSRASILY